VSAPTYYRMRSKGRCPECGKRTADRCPTCGTLHRGVYCRECRAYHRKRLALKRADNRAAIALYKGMGFKAEGVHRCAIRVDGKYFDQLAMALIDRDS